MSHIRESEVITNKHDPIVAVITQSNVQVIAEDVIGRTLTDREIRRISRLFNVHSCAAAALIRAVEEAVKCYDGQVDTDWTSVDAGFRPEKISKREVLVV